MTMMGRPTGALDPLAPPFFPPCLVLPSRLSSMNARPLTVMGPRPVSKAACTPSVAMISPPVHSHLEIRAEEYNGPEGTCTERLNLVSR